MGRDSAQDCPAHSDDEEQDHGAIAVEPDWIDWYQLRAITVAAIL